VGKLSRYLTLQGDPAVLGAMLAELDGPTLPIATLAEAATWLTRFTKSYHYSIEFQRASAEPENRPPNHRGRASDVDRHIRGRSGGL
jgi:hypothetical protein